MKALICGVSGQDGAYLARLLLQKGYEVYGTSRDSYINFFLNLSSLDIKDDVETLSMAINDFRSVVNVLKNVAPDEIYNLAGQSSVGLSFEQPVETLESNNTGTLNLLEAIRFLDLPVKFYNAGSSECFGNTQCGGADESTPFQPRSPYAIAKSSAFWLVNNYREAYKLFACNGILFNHESPLRPTRFVTKKIISTACRIAQGSNERLALGNIDIMRDWGWAPEYVEAMWLMLQQEEADDFVIATKTVSSLKDFVETTFDSLGLNWIDHVDTSPQLLRPTDINFSCGNPTKANYKLGWQAKTKMKDVVKLMVESESVLSSQAKQSLLY